MNLSKFIDFNKSCPVCDKPLSLFLQFHDSILWKAEVPVEGKYEFRPFIEKKVKAESDKNLFVSFDNDVKFETSSEILVDAKKHSMHFFYLCTESGIKVRDAESDDYEIELYEGCYFRSSIDIDFKREPNNQWNLHPVVGDIGEPINQEESFSFKKNHEPDIEKVYLLSIKTLENATDFWFYETNESERVSESYEPKVFEKKMPLLKTRPKLDAAGRDKLISRMDSWILIS